MYLADDGHYLLFASAAGVDRSPTWYWNLIANPDASIEVADEHLHVHAVELSAQSAMGSTPIRPNGIRNTPNTSA